MTAKQESALTWMKVAAPYIIFLLSMGVWCGRLEARLNGEIERRHEAAGTIEYIRRQNTQILVELGSVNESLKYIKKELSRCGAN